MDRTKKPRDVMEYIYWAIFIFFAVFMSNVILTTIHTSANEQTAFLSSSKKRTPVRIAVLETSKGNITISLKQSSAPIAVANFSQLASSGFYDGTKFHRVLKNVLIQGGDPLSREGNKELYGTGGPGYVFEDELNGTPLRRGVVAFANRGKPNTNESQFFIVVSDEGGAEIEGEFTVFGQVVTGMEVVDEINKVSVDSKRIPLSPVYLNLVTVE